MIGIETFNEIRQTNHLVVLDTNVLLELYRQPTNISIDIISSFDKIKNNLYIPYQVYIEFLKHHQKICGDEKKRYKKIENDLSNTINNLQDSINSKINSYRKHNYTDISLLHQDLENKIIEIKDTVKEFTDNQEKIIKSNLEFFEKDKVLGFVEAIKSNNRIGNSFTFSEKLKILEEGKLRYDNLIPPGYADNNKQGVDKYGDLFVWKEIISAAKSFNSNIIFVCNDTKEDWWEREKDFPIDLRHELCEEFQEINPSLKIHFLTLDKFFSYIAEEFGIGMSKSALQLSAKEDGEKYLFQHNDNLEDAISKFLLSLDLTDIIKDDEVDFENDYIYWKIKDVIVDKEEKTINYYIDLDISVLSDMIIYDDSNSISYTGKLAIAIEGNAKISLNEYSTQTGFAMEEISLYDTLKIDYDTWKNLNITFNEKTCKEIITMCKAYGAYSDLIKFNLNNYINYSNSIPLDTVKSSIESFSNILKATDYTAITANLSSALNILSKYNYDVSAISNAVSNCYKLFDKLKFNNDDDREINETGDEEDNLDNSTNQIN